MSSIIKVDNIQNQSGANIIKEDSNTITLGASGDTVTLASGASQSGFGRTGTVDWQTGSIKTATFTAASGEGYFCNTAGGSFTMNLPAGSAGAIVSVQDYNNTFDTSALTVDANGSEKINGGIGGEPVQLNTEGRGVTFVYIDATVGWRSVQDNDFTKKGITSTFVSATGGTIITCGDFKTHVFTGPGTFCVAAASGPVANVDYVVVAGGGSGASGHNNNTTGAGGGGAGGFRVSNSVGCVPAPTMSPLVNATNIPVTVQGYGIVVGGGGTGGNNPGPNRGTNGSVSTFSTITSAGGGAGGSGYNVPEDHQCGASGGSGGGAGASCSPSKTTGGGAVGNTPPVSPPQGNNGGDRVSCNAGSGGGAGAVGGDGQPPGDGPGAPAAGSGGIGSFVADAFIKPGCAPSYGTPGPVSSTRYFAGGGGAGASAFTSSTAATGGAGGGGNGGNYPAGAGSAGTTNTGGAGGGGGTNSGSVGGNGGSGIVIIRYKFQ